MKKLLSLLGSFSGTAAILGLISLFAAALVYLFLPGVRTSVWSLLALGGILLLLFVLGAFRQIRTTLAGRRGRYGTNTVAMVLAFIGIIVLANYLGYANHRRFDVTASGQFTLAPQTKRVLQELKQPVMAIGFFPNVPEYEAARQEAQNLLREYRYVSRKLDFDFVDPDAKPAVAQEYQVRSYGTIVFESAAGRRQVMNIDEYAFTSAVLEVTGERQKTVYFLTGHGEHDIGSAEKEGYSLAAMGLMKDLYRIGVLDLALTPEVPSDAAVLIIAGPKKPLPEAEVKVIRDYLLKAGKILFLLDPNPPAELGPILAEWGLALGKGTLIDEMAYALPDKTTPAVLSGRYYPEGQYFTSVVTSGLDRTYFPAATSVVLTEEVARALRQEQELNVDIAIIANYWWQVQQVAYKSIGILPLAITSPVSWLETNLEERQFDEKADTRGPLALGAMVVGGASLRQEKASPEVGDKLTRLVVIGDSDFASNAHFSSGGNSDLFLNSVSWLAEEESLIAIRPKTFTFRRLLVSQDALRFIRYSSILLLPLAVLVVAGMSWWRRR